MFVEPTNFGAYKTFSPGEVAGSHQISLAAFVPLKDRYLRKKKFATLVKHKAHASYPIKTVATAHHS
jgi:hypothetical protein